jgi:hypothetical protein
MAAWQSRRARAWCNCTAPADLNASCGIVLLNAVPASSSLLTGSLLVFSQNSPDCSGNQATIVIGEYVKADTCSRRTRDARNVTGTVWCFSGTKIICRRDALRAYRRNCIPFPPPVAWNNAQLELLIPRPCMHANSCIDELAARAFGLARLLYVIVTFYRALTCATGARCVCSGLGGNLMPLSAV